MPQNQRKSAENLRFPALFEHSKKRELALRELQTTVYLRISAFCKLRDSYGKAFRELHRRTF